MESLIIMAIFLCLFILFCLISILFFEFIEGWKAKIWYRKFKELYKDDPFYIYKRNSNENND